MSASRWQGSGNGARASVRVLVRSAGLWISLCTELLIHA